MYGCVCFTLLLLRVRGVCFTLLLLKLRGVWGVYVYCFTLLLLRVRGVWGCMFIALHCCIILGQHFVATVHIVSGGNTCYTNICHISF